MSEMARQHVCEQEGAVKQMEREREEDRAAIKEANDRWPLPSNRELFRYQQWQKKHAAAIQRATQAPA